MRRKVEMNSESFIVWLVGAMGLKSIALELYV